MGIARCKRGARMMREIGRLKNGAVGMKTNKMRSFSECASADDFFAQYVCGGGTNLSSPSPNPNTGTSSPPRQQNQAKDLSSPITAAVAADKTPLTYTSPPPLHPNPTEEKSVLSVPQTPPIAHITDADDSFAQFLIVGGSKGNPNSKPPSPPPTAAAAASNSSSSSSVQQWQPYPMPYVVMVDGEIRVMSRFFPPPPNAIIIHAEEEEVEEVVVEVEVLMVPASNPTRKRKNTAEEMLELGGDAKNTRKKMRIKQRSVLTAAEKRKDCYRRVVNGSSAWVPPSPYKLLQEQHFSDPWRVIIICMLLNLTTGTQVKQILDDLFLLCPNAEAAARVSRKELRQLLKPLGLWRKRARCIKKFSCQYLESDWTHITQLHGVGKYAADAYAIFCVGEPEEVVPEDHKLVDYWRFVCEKRIIEHQQQSTGEFTEGENSGGTVCWSENCDFHDPSVC